jgi:hypothetical protein
MICISQALAILGRHIVSCTGVPWLSRLPTLIDPTTDSRASTRIIGAVFLLGIRTTSHFTSEKPAVVFGSHTEVLLFSI